MADLTTVPAVELLTRAADAARTAATVFGAHVSVVIEPAVGEPDHTGVTLAVANTGRRIKASSPDHWRAVDATFRAAIKVHGPDHAGCWERCSMSCRWVLSLRPLAEQVLRDLGDT